MLNFLRNLNLSKKLISILIAVFLGGIALTISALAIILNSNAKNQVAVEARILIQTMSAIRTYTSNQIRPKLALQSEIEFLPQTVPAYSAREIFETFRKDKSWSEYFYKEATLNPTNLRDKADPFEIEIVNSFRQDANRKELSGFRYIPSGKLFYIAMPLAVTESSCLECHSTVDVAPKSMIDRYGTANGFGWKLNEIVAAKIVYVPASQVFQRTRQSLVAVMGIVIGIFAVAIYLVNLWLNRYIVRPLNRMTQIAEAVSMGEMDAEFDQKANDEVGRLAKAFTLMKTSLGICMNRLEDARLKRSRASEL